MKKIVKCIIKFFVSVKNKVFQEKNYSDNEVSVKRTLYLNYFNIVLVGDSSLSLADRTAYMIKVIYTFAPIAYIMSIFDLWFETNKMFFTAIVLIININMFFGMVMHKIKNTFKWDEMLKKTIIMVSVIIITYVVLEMMLMVAGENDITSIFRTILQVATVMYPISKILKNVFILSKGEYPPQWLMQKVYNFQENGDLAAFLSANKPAEKDSDSNSVS